MVVMQRSAPERPGHPVRISVQEQDVGQLQKRGWFVVPPEVKPEEGHPVEAVKDAPVEMDKDDVPDAGKSRRGNKRHEV